MYLYCIGIVAHKKRYDIFIYAVLLFLFVFIVFVFVVFVFVVFVFIVLALLPTRKGMMRPRLPECSFLLSHLSGCNDFDEGDVDGNDDDDY